MTPNGDILEPIEEHYGSDPEAWDDPPAALEAANKMLRKTGASFVILMLYERGDGLTVQGGLHINSEHNPPEYIASVLGESLIRAIENKFGESEDEEAQGG